MKSIVITKASGDQEPFDEEKLRRSLRACDTDDETIEQIIETVQEMLFDGITTQQIYKEAFRLLRKRSLHSAGRYKLKEAILELGPTGYPFERYIGEVLKRSGFVTQVGVVVQGNCITHEIDVIAEKNDIYYLIECKFHNRKGDKCNVKVPLYIQSRFTDVETNWRSQPGHKSKEHQGWVVTNSRFTLDAQKYAQCMGLKLLGWDYPRKEGLKDLISKVDLHPVTCLSTLTKSDKEKLLEKDVVLCTQLCESDTHLESLGMDSRKRSRVLKEAREICNGNGRWTTG